jgi:Zn-finger nucleic acid-binding protein
MSERLCPRCQDPMLTGRLGPIELDGCRLCGGIWFDCDELANLTVAGPEVMRRLLRDQSPGTAPPSDIPLGPATCPSCHAALQTIEYESMQSMRLESCAFCEGHWLSQTTLRRFIAAVEGRTEWDVISTEVNPHARPAERPSGSTPAVAGAPAPPALRGSSGFAVPSAGLSGIGGSPAQVSPVGSAPPPSAATATCPKCGEMNSALAAACWACGQHLQAPVVGSCPRCEAGMRRVVSGETTISGCEGCGGAWLTPNRLRELLKQEFPERNRLIQQLSQYRTERIRRIRPLLNCPHCANAMNGAPLGAVTRLPVHGCPQCASMFIDFVVAEDILLRQQ